MSEAKDVAVLVGSLRQESFTRKTALAIAALAPASLKLDIVDIGQLALYNQDLDMSSPPAPWADFRSRLKAADAILFATPEYNRSVPGVLKNAIDVGSRPYGQSAFDGKPGAVVSVSPGSLGAFAANHHLRQSLVYLNVLAMPQPEAYIGHVAKLFDDTGQLVNEDTRKLLTTFGERFADWIALWRH